MQKQRPWAEAGQEPSIAELLADPVGVALMQADGIMVKDVVALIARVQNDIRRYAHCGEFPPPTAPSHHVCTGEGGVT